MLHKNKPKNFNSKFEAVGCFVQYNDKIIILHRQDSKPQGNTWGIPSGKVRANEKPELTAIRETYEETGLQILPLDMLFLKTVFVKFSDYDFVYHIFHAKLKDKQNIKINHSEHKNGIWITPKKALSLPLIQDLDNCIYLYFDKMK